MTHFPPIVIAVVIAALVIAITALARRLPIPTPILQVTAGAIVGLLPGVSFPQLDPDIVFFVFLPPILWAAAYFTSLREFRADIRPISLLAVGLVVVTTAAVAIVARQLNPNIPWAVAVALGAIVSPPDAVAATAIVSRLPVPRRVIVILEGESLVNDASALVLYRTAVAAAVTGVFSWGESIVRFFIDAGVGTLIGLLVGWLIIAALKRTRDSLAEVLATLAGPYLAWVAAETVHVSAVLACVAGGLYTRQHLSTVISPISRIQSRAVWDLFVFLLNALVFLVLGAQFGELVAAVPPESLTDVAVAGLIITAVVVAVRIVWVPFAFWGPRLLNAEIRAREVAPQRKVVGLISWTAMRGIVSLATAFALPLTLGDGSPFPYRSELILITMVVIVLTLAAQGFTLAPIIKWMKFAPERQHHAEERIARREMARRAAEALEDQARLAGVDKADVQWLRLELSERHREAAHEGGTVEGRRKLRMHMIAAQRRMLVRLRNEGTISDEVLTALERELDFDAIRSGSGEER
jgi:Na+/H+ antiporter